jgi:D-beta-D-heptose 7-phosphate kinase/D-beta-D-heptose 1-phosphate adenosyltransferase
MRVVFTNGCFDILHRGHIEYLKQSRSLGDFLVVGVNSDASVRRLKGDSRPFNTEANRVAVLEALRCVDKVVVFDADTPYKIIQEICPSIITKGGDYVADDVVGSDLARVVILPYLDGYSTTRILDAA